MGDSIRALLRPERLAIVGASPKEGSFGSNLLQSVRALNFPGAVALVNPRYDRIGDLACHGSIASVPGGVDCAAFAVGDAHLTTSLREAAAAGLKAAVLFGRAHGEEDGRPRQEIIRDIAQGSGMAICGANCMGFVNLGDRLQLTGMPFRALPATSGVALISHSGSTWSGLVGNRRQMGFDYAISAGQELATGVAGYIRFLIRETDVRVIACVLETIRDPDGFIGAVTLAREKGVPVVVLKLGRSAAAKQFAISHSGALSGSNAGYDAVFARHGVIQVRSLDELLDTAELMALRRVMPAAGIAPRCAETKSINPTEMAGDPGVGILVMATNLPPDRPFSEQSATAIRAVHAATDKPVVVMGNIASTISPAIAAELRGRGIAVLMGTASGLAALGHLRAWRFAAPVPDDTAALPLSVAAVERIAGAPLDMLRSFDGFGLLAGAGIPCAAVAEITAPAQIGAFAAEHGWPLVLKIDDAAIAHKSDQGGVFIGLRDEEEALVAWNALRQRHPAAPVIVQAMETGTEIILGMTTDPDFGPLITLGLGGVFAEILRDTTTLLPPYSPATARRALESLQAFPLLTGARARPPADLDALCALISRFSAFAAGAADHLREIEINPVLAGPKGAVAVDCIALRQTPKQKEAARHGQ